MKAVIAALIFQASQAMQAPFDSSNFDSALKFVVQRAPNQV
jgi:hypothetical protein